MRTAQIERKTAETDISLRLDLDGSGESSINHARALFEAAFLQEHQNLLHKNQAEAGCFGL